MTAKQLEALCEVLVDYERGNARDAAFVLLEKYADHEARKCNYTNWQELYRKTIWRSPA